jgi:phytanoyl-CoA hydroxylase
MSSDKKFTFTGALTQEQIDFFNLHGSIHFEHYASEETVQAILASTETVQEQWIANDVQKVNGVPIKYGKDETGKKIVHRRLAPWVTRRSASRSRASCSSLLLPGITF